MTGKNQKPVLTLKELANLEKHLPDPATVVENALEITFTRADDTVVTVPFKKMSKTVKVKIEMAVTGQSVPVIQPENPFWAADVTIIFA